MTSLATFNANNFFLRYKFSRTYPGDMSKASSIEASAVGTIGYLPGLAFGKYTKRYIIWDAQRRELAAQALHEPDGCLPDILCFQEVENIHAIRLFNQKYLGNHYPYSLLIDGCDSRHIDVGLLSKFPIRDVRSHIDERNDQGNRIFSRDCLEAEIELPNGSILTLLLNHLKSKLVIRKEGETDAQYHARVLESHEKRLSQATAVAKYVDSRFCCQHDQALYAVVGDFNDTPQSPWVKPLVNSPHLTNILTRHRESNDCWTYYWRSRNRVSQIDYILASRALTKLIDDAVTADSSKKPHIERQGLAYREKNKSDQILPMRSNLVHFEADPVTDTPACASPNEKVNFRFQRYAEVLDNWKANVSDHCPVKVWF